MATMTRNLSGTGRCENPSSGEWPNGTDFTATGKYGRYIDIPLKDAAKDLGFLLLDRNKQGDDVKIRKEDYKFTDLKIIAKFS